MKLLWIIVMTASFMLMGFSISVMIGELIGFVELMRDARQDLAILVLATLILGDSAAKRLSGASGNE